MKTFGLRLDGCAKNGDTSKVLQLLSEDPAVTHWLQVPDDGSQILDLSSLTIQEPTLPAEDVTLLDVSELEAFCAKVALEFPHLERDATERSGVASFRRLAPAPCTSCDRVHESEGAYVAFRSGVYYLNCRRADKEAKALLVHRTAEAEKKEDLLPEDRDDFERIEADIVSNERFNANAFAHLLTDAGRSDLYIRARWKTGKTVFAGQLIKAVRDRNPAARVAILSCRKCLSTSLAADFGAADYREIKGGEFDEAQALKHPVTV